MEGHAGEVHTADHRRDYPVPLWIRGRIRRTRVQSDRR